MDQNPETIVFSNGEHVMRAIAYTEINGDVFRKYTHHLQNGEIVHTWFRYDDTEF